MLFLSKKFIFLVALYAALSFEAESRELESPVEDKNCINTDVIVGYHVESDELVRFMTSESTDILVRLKRHCPQLHFHKYVGYSPVNGQLCAHFDDLVTRTGMPCRIESFSVEAKQTNQSESQPPNR